jgi:hypothetical protein
MGYCMSQTDGKFFIAADKMSEALKATKAMDTKSYHWVEKGWSKGLVHLKEVLSEWGYSGEFDDDLNLIELHFNREKLGEEFEMFKVLAPFVKAGSFIEMTGEDGEQWRWVFDGTECKQIYPTVSWE